MKELQADYGLQWYDYGARFYDPTIIRFHTIDRLAEKFSFQSPYCYAANSPIRYIDVNGLGPGDRLLASSDFYGIPYARQSGSNRTSWDANGMDSMDCSEHICRVMYLDGMTGDELLSLNSDGLADYFADAQNNFEEITDYNKIEPGDFISMDGHVALFAGYNNDESKLNVSHHTRYRYNGKTTATGLKESYKKKFFEDRNAKFYRPKNETPDGKYKKGDKLGYAKTFAKDPAFYEEFIIPELDKRLAEEYKYNVNDAQGEEEPVE